VSPFWVTCSDKISVGGQFPALVHAMNRLVCVCLVLLHQESTSEAGNAVGGFWFWFRRGD